MVSEQIAHGHHEADHGEGHSTPAMYVRVALILAVITVIEVIIWYLPSTRGILTPALIILSLAKFLAVVGYFMHLKFDKPIFRFMFFAGLLLSLGVFLAMLAMFWSSTSFYPVIGG